MKLEVYSAQKLSQKGSSLKKMIQNNDMPVLDLLVRESIQNSLDAKDDSSEAKFVRVDFNYGSFDRDALNWELDGVDLTRKPMWGNQFLSISDRNTVGLTGSIEDKGSNLYKLVFGIMDAQQASGAGGSWGIGKTVYFRVGVGMVLYYSRIKTEYGYESLLSAAFVEDETSDESLLPAVNGQKYGIAWWGDEISTSSHSVHETRDPYCIERVLNAFNLSPYVNKETGTIIIIPFIDEDYLLSHNQPAREDGVPAPLWMSSLKDYLRLSVQKWYIARLNNRKYVHGKYLNVSINGKAIGPDDIEPFFKLTQRLYNKASLSIVNSPEVDNIQYADAEINSLEIRVNSQIYPNCAGYVAYTKVNRKQLEMTFPDNKPSPYEYINSTVDEEDFGRPILMFCRKPGMVVSYETEGKWLKAVPKTSDDEYVIAWFVLNPQPKLTSADISLEDYVRRSEMADHSSWDDCALESQKPAIISRIQKGVSRKLGEAFEDVKDDIGKKTDTGLGTLLGRVLLPPEGFGSKASSPPQPSASSSTTRKSVRYSYSVLKFIPGGMLLVLSIKTGKKKVTGCGFSLEMDSIRGTISALDWESEMGLSLPFCINAAKLSMIIDDNQNTKEELWDIIKGDDSQLGQLIIKQRLTGEGDWYGIEFSFSDGEAHSANIAVVIGVSIRRKDVKPSLSFD